MSFSQIYQDINNKIGATAQNISNSASNLADKVRTQGQLLGHKIDTAAVNKLGREKTDMIYRILRNLPLAGAIAAAPLTLKAAIFLGFTVYVCAKNKTIAGDNKSAKKSARKIMDLVGTYFALAAMTSGYRMFQSYPVHHFASMLLSTGAAAWMIAKANNLQRQSA